MDIEDSEAHSSHENAPKSLSFKQAYHFFTQSKNSQNAIEQKTFESKIESVMSIKFPAQTHKDVYRALKKRHSEVSKMNETIKAQKLNTGFWQKQAYSSTSSGAEVLNPVLPITPVKQRDREHPMNIDESPSDQNRDNLLHVTPPQRRKRIDSLYKELENFAAEENLTPT